MAQVPVLTASPLFQPLGHPQALNKYNRFQIRLSLCCFTHCGLAHASYRPRRLLPHSVPLQLILSAPSVNVSSMIWASVADHALLMVALDLAQTSLSMLVLLYHIIFAFLFQITLRLSRTRTVLMPHTLTCTCSTMYTDARASATRVLAYSSLECFDSRKLGVEWLQVSKWPLGDRFENMQGY